MSPTTETSTPRRTLVLRVVAVVGVVLFLAFVMLFADAVGRLDALKRGFREGFVLNGSYTRPWSDIHDGVREGPMYQMAFLAEPQGDYEGLFQLRVSDRDNINGLYKPTDDPNYYLLMTKDGEEVGWVHVAYTNRQAEGIIYAGYKDETFYLEKYDRIPGFVSPAPDE